MKTKSRWITGNFVRFLTGRTLSVLGGNVMRFALSLYILEQTGSAAEYGTVLALGYVPTILLSPLRALEGLLLAVCAALHAGAAFVALTLRIPRTEREGREGTGAAVWKDLREILRLAFVQRGELGRVMLFNALLTLLLNPFLAMGVTYTVSVRLGLPAVWNGTAQSIIGASTLLGCWLAGRAVGRFRVRQLYLLFLAAGAGLLPAALALAEGVPEVMAYALTVLSGAVIVVLCYFAGVYIVSGLQGIIYDQLSGALPVVFTAMSAMVMLIAACSRRIYAALDEKSALTNNK